MTEYVRYNHYHNDDGKLFMTTCDQYSDESMNLLVASGIAICSDRDQFSRKTGREISLSRMKKALLSKRHTLPIKRRDIPVIRQALCLVPAFKSIYGGRITHD